MKDKIKRVVRKHPRLLIWLIFAFGYVGVNTTDREIKMLLFLVGTICLQLAIARYVMINE